MANNNTEPSGDDPVNKSVDMPGPLPIDDLPTTVQEAVPNQNAALTSYKATTPSKPVAKSVAKRVVNPGKLKTRLQAVGTVVSVRTLKKTYMLGQTPVYALRGISLDIFPGEFVAVMGPSGSGKSTFMNLIGCLDRPTQGEYWLAGKLVSRMSNDELASVRNRMIGFVFQGFNLLARATALSNVALPMVYAGLPAEVRDFRARKALQLVGLGSRMHHKPTQLSGGQQQRVAIARSLVNAPSLLLADEPTGNLDSRTSIEIMALLQALNQQGLTIVLVTHESDIAAYTKRQVQFRDGRLIRDEHISSPRSAQEEWLKIMNMQSQEKTP